MKPVTRLEVVQSLLDLHDAPDYLEVGVCEASTFRHVRARAKVAVDPRFARGVLDEFRDKAGVEMHEVTSDAYFGARAGDRRFDVVYLDGLHTFEQTLRDLLNAVAVLKPRGVVLVDDVVPDTYHGSLPDRDVSKLLMRATGQASRKWMGDVYRLAFFVDTFLQQWTHRTVADNHGQLVLWRRARPAVTERQVEWIARAPFEQVHVEAEAFRRAPLAQIVAEVARDVAPGRAIPAA